ncbi:MAG: diacylglycerol kinase [Gammaproteobacteria bacterium]|nr:diacylglycerol kinase [Gammaproteobacteria bacterium]
MGKPGNTGLKRIVRAGYYSWKGLRSTFRHEAAFRQELLLFVILAPAALYFGQTGVERALLISVLMLVLVVEVLNSGIEAVVDRFGPEQHRLSGRAKDMGSAASFIAQVNVLVVWGLVLFG